MVIYMKQKNSYHMNIGGASILLVLAIFALTVFAILSLRASYHELKMSEKTRDSVQAYYEADARAEEVYMLITQTLASKESLTTEQFLEKLSNIESLQMDETTNIITYVVPMDYNMVLQVQLKLPESLKGLAKIQSWRMITSDQGDYDAYGTEEIWDGILD